MSALTHKQLQRQYARAYARVRAVKTGEGPASDHRLALQALRTARTKLEKAGA